MSDITKAQAREVVVSRGRGLEAPIEKEDLLIPRAKLLQQMSPEIIDGAEGLKPGAYINSITKEVLPVEFVPVFYFVQWIRFNPRDQKAHGYDPAFAPGDMVYRTSDPSDSRLTEDGIWQGDLPPLATKFMSFFSYFPGVAMPIVVSFSKTGIKTGKTLLSLIKFSGQDAWAKKYKLTSKKITNDKGTFFIPEVNLAGAPTDEEFSFCEGLYKNFREKELQVHSEDADHEEEKAPF